MRGCIADFWHSQWSIVPVQLLDGMGADVPGVVAVLLRGSGHVNLGLGMVMTMQGMGAAFSTTWGDLFARYAGYSAAVFLALAAAPCVARFCLLRGCAACLPCGVPWPGRGERLSFGRGGGKAAGQCPA